MQAVDAINERANGAVVINYLGGPEVVNPHEQGIAVKNGVIDMSMLPTAYYEGLVPEGAMLILSRLNAAEEREAGVEEYMRNLHEEVDLFYFSRLPNVDRPEWTLGFTEPIGTPYDLAGRVLGGSSLVSDSVAGAMGMGFTLVPMPDAYTAIERGVIDAYSNPAHTTVAFGFHEVLPYYVVHPYFTTNLSVIINLDTWTRIPKHVQDLMRDTYLEFEPKLVEQYRDEETKAFSEWNKLAQPVEFSPSDAEWFVETIWDFEIQRVLKDLPEHGPKLLELMGAR